MAKKKAKAPEITDGEEPPKKKGGGMIATIITAVALGGASFATVFMLPDKDAKGDGYADGVACAADAKADQPEMHELRYSEDASYVTLEPLTITIGGGTNLLKIGIVLETTDSDIDPNDPLLRDSFTGYLRALKLEQIHDAAYMTQMRAQLLRRAQLIKGRDTVSGVLITEFLLR